MFGQPFRFTGRFALLRRASQSAQRRDRNDRNTYNGPSTSAQSATPAVHRRRQPNPQQSLSQWAEKRGL